MPNKFLKKRKAYIFWILPLFVIHLNIKAQTPAIPILEAIDKKLILHSASGHWDPSDKTEYTDADGMYYGRCMQLQLKNPGDDTLRISIPEGLLLISEDSTVQDMLVTQALEAILYPGKTKSYRLYAMCSEIHDKMPASFTKYKAGKMGDANLVAIAHVINKHFMQNMIGQNAVWAYTDNATLAELKNYGATKESIELTLGLLEKAGVKTKLAEDLNYISPESFVKVKDTLLVKLKLEQEKLQAKLETQEGKISMHPFTLYLGIGAIVFLAGMSATLVYRGRSIKKRDDVA